VPDAAGNRHAVTLDLHPAAAAMAELAACQIAVERVAVERQPGR
jgi:hypothetical protein